MSTDPNQPDLPPSDADAVAPENTSGDEPQAAAAEPPVPAVGAPEPDVPAVTSGDATEVSEPEVPAASVEPSIASGLEIGGESVEILDEEAFAKSDPVIRGKVDRYGVAWGTGRRKTAVARVRLKDGQGDVTINGRTLEEYFPIGRDQKLVFGPLEATDLRGKVDIIVNVRGGGPTGQTGAVVLGIARAIQAKNPDLHHHLSDGGFLTRDGRMVERKKYGLKKARKSFQFSKR